MVENSTGKDDSLPLMRLRKQGMSMMLQTPLPALDDAEGDKVDEALPFTVDAHIHVFPDAVFSAIWEWFALYAWPIRYQLTAEGVIDFALSRGMDHVVALHYAHTPGISRYLNSFMAKLCADRPQVTGSATVLPGEYAAEEILDEAFANGLECVKLHAHVQFFDMDSDDIREVCHICESRNKPLVIHAGREPKSPAYEYLRDPHQLCSAEKMERILKEFPNLKVCVPHVGADEFTAYGKLLERHDNLWVDTAMVLADYFPDCELPPLAEMRTERIMYGTDFPNIPYAWDRELKRLCGLGLSEDKLALILGENAREFFALPLRPGYGKE